MDEDIKEAWTQLQTISTLTFNSSSTASVKTGWVGRGQGVVAMEMPDTSTIIYKENGTWNPANGRAMAFHNTYRWKLCANGISLEHLRFGPSAPVFLFQLEVADPQTLRSACPHACAEDSYQAILNLGNPLKVTWTVNGPKFSETIEYRYHRHDQR